MKEIKKLNDNELEKIAGGVNLDYNIKSVFKDAENEFRTTESIIRSVERNSGNHTEDPTLLANMAATCEAVADGSIDVETGMYFLQNLCDKLTRNPKLSAQSIIDKIKAAIAD